MNSRAYPLFPRLLSLVSSDRGCTEDFFTEVVAAVLRHHPPILWQWLRMAWPPYDPGEDEIIVQTQVRRPKLKAADSDSIIDLVVYRVSPSRRDVAYVESKVDAAEGHEQLKRYAEHLEKEEADNRLLAYVTRDHVPDGSIHEDVCHLRWSTLYHAISEHDVCPLISETKALMEHLRMGQANDFTPQDLFVANEAPRALGKMVEVLNRIETSDLFRRLSTQQRTVGVAYGQLLAHERFVIGVRTTGGCGKRTPHGTSTCTWDSS